MDRYVVIGNPVAHSLSPEIHARFAEQTGERIEYFRMLVPEGRFMIYAQEFFDGGGRGANVTLPFKVNAFHWATHHSERALRAGAANFLVQRERLEIFADNTDGAGLVADLRDNLGVTLRDASIVLVGAGGAARGVIAPLLAQRPRALLIANRTAAKADELAREFGALGSIAAASLDAIPPGPYDVVINATSTSTRGVTLDLPRIRWSARTLAYDMAYGPAAKAFLARAAEAGARVSDGLGMLVEQAAESFELWRGKRPETGPVLQSLRARLE
ncbi:MAG TPA: shikimate dehydrogenase [Usitatibacter sp.]|nr:shikimate dehydrogenase [Usitatibacter sp.]